MGPQQHIPLKLWISVLCSEPFGQGGWDPWVFLSQPCIIYFITLPYRAEITLCAWLHPWAGNNFASSLNISNHSMPSQANPVLSVGLQRARGRPPCKEERTSPWDIEAERTAFPKAWSREMQKQNHDGTKGPTQAWSQHPKSLCWILLRVLSPIKVTSYRPERWLSRCCQVRCAEFPQGRRELNSVVAMGPAHLH